MVAPSTVRATNAQLSSLTTPTTAVFVGGTSGIGRATLLTLARRKTNGLKVYIIGRNAASHQSLLDELQTLNRNGQFIFLEARVSLLKEVKDVCDKIKEKETRIDLLWLSAGAIPLEGRKGNTFLRYHSNEGS